MAEQRRHNLDKLTSGDIVQRTIFFMSWGYILIRTGLPVTTLKHFTSQYQVLLQHSFVGLNVERIMKEILLTMETDELLMLIAQGQFL